MHYKMTQIHLMNTEPSYIFQHSLLTREVFIIYKCKEDLNYLNHEEP